METETDMNRLLETDPASDNFLMTASVENPLND